MKEKNILFSSVLSEITALSKIRAIYGTTVGKNGLRWRLQFLQ